MNRFFYEKKGKKYGPFTLSELGKKNIKDETLVWKQDLEGWVKASTLEELKSIIVNEPPPLPNEKIKIKKKKEYINYTYAGIGLLGLNIFSRIIGGIEISQPIIILEIIVRVFVALKVADVAADQGRWVVISGALGGFFPSFTLIIIGLLDKKEIN